MDKRMMYTHHHHQQHQKQHEIYEKNIYLDYYYVE